MGFAFPLFLLAGLALAIPILIHLFNLRKYKKISFPSLKFLKEFNVKNKKMSKIQKRYLLAARLLALLFLILAFAQPFFTNLGKKNNALYAVYIDNSMSSTYRQGQTSILDQSKTAAVNWLKSIDKANIFLLTNDHLFNTQKVERDKAIELIYNIEPASSSVNAAQLKNAVSQISESNPNNPIEVVAFSDFQASTWNTEEKSFIKDKQSTHFNLIPIEVQPERLNNIYIDTAFIQSMPPDASLPATLISIIKRSGAAKASTYLEVRTQNQIIHSKEITFEAADTVQYDTATIRLAAGKWNDITVGFKSKHAPFDDYFYIAARTRLSQNALILSQGASNNFITSAIRTQANANAITRNFNSELPADITQYPLVILDNIKSISQTQTSTIKKWLKRGQSVALFFGKNASKETTNNALKQLGAITITKVDTSLQQTVELQPAHPLLKGVLVNTPDNLQLPYTQYTYKLKLGIATAAQTLLKFRDGSPFFSQMSLFNGKLYICAAPLDATTNSFVQSYYFAPILYKMMANSTTNNVLAATIQQKERIWIPSKSEDERSIVKLVKDGQELIPIQQPKGVGTEILIPEKAPQAGFYTITNENKNEDALIGLNHSREESELTPCSKQALKKAFSQNNTTVLTDINNLAKLKSGSSQWPLWKLATLLSLLFLLLETFLISKRPKTNP